MFTPDEIYARVRGQPFIPLRIVTTTGQQFDICCPELVMVGRRDMTVGKASGKNPAQYEQLFRIALTQIAALEDLPSSPLGEANGGQ